MPGRIPQSFIDELLARSDIVELIGTRVPLKKSGREFKACCPFHDEKTPSFWVSPDKQFFHCFGCGAHGTALGFLIQYDQLPFVEAVDELAGRLGLEVPHEGGAPPPTPHEGLSELLGRVAGYYNETLKTTPRAVAYLRERGLDDAIIERFRIGYAPDAWGEVLRRFGGSVESRQALLDTGLIIARDAPRPGLDAHYDRFRDRIMFPIRDPRGRAIAFGGRILDKGEPKYLNSPETALFHKGRELYGLHEIRQSRQKLERLLVVEGFMDVVRLHQAGLSYAVATLGTATTAEHLRRAFKLVNEIVFAFDGDRAGRAAAWRALQHVLGEAREGREVRFLFLPDGEDPDSLIGKEGRVAFERRLAGAEPLSEYLLKFLRAQVDMSHADGRARLVALMRPLIAQIQAGIYRELLIERLAVEVGLDADRLRQSLDSPTAGAGAGAAAGASATTGSSSPMNGSPRPVEATRPLGRGGVITQAIQLLLHFPAAARQVPTTLVTALLYIDRPGVTVLHELLTQLQDEGTALTVQALLERWQERPEGRRLFELAHTPPLAHDADAAERELNDALMRLTGPDRRRHRLDELIAKDGQGRLDDAEKIELQSLVRSLRGMATKGDPGP